MDLITEAGYLDPKTIVVKFRRGLDPLIQNAIATMANGRPSDTVPSEWYSAARTIDENQATNDAFKSSYRTPTSAPTAGQPQSRPPTFNTFRLPAPPRQPARIPTPGNPVPMDVDATWKREPLPFRCYRCGDLNHLSKNCPHRFDIQTMDADELQHHLEDYLAALDVAPEEPKAEEVEEEVEEDFTPSSE